jgi:hypothetical protein
MSAAEIASNKASGGVNMECPLVLYPSGSLGTVQYLAPCACMKLCDFAKCKYRKNGFLVKIQAVGTVTTNTVNILGKKCGASMPLVSASNNALVTNADLTAGNVYTVVPTTVNGVLRGVVQGL